MYGIKLILIISHEAILDTSLPLNNLCSQEICIVPIILPFLILYLKPLKKGKRLNRDWYFIALTMFFNYIVSQF